MVADFEVDYAKGVTIHSTLAIPTTGFNVTALFGPSGCGKTTTLRCLAGLERPDKGHIQFGQQVWFDSATNYFLTPQQRNIGYLFQDYALFPHYRVADNIGYGLRALSRTERNRRVGELMERFGLIGLESRYPHEISGGQQQRIALARVLARRPSLLLLDEPLSALDTALREQLRRELRELLVGFDIPMILVTHDRNEAVMLADQLVVMSDGQMIQNGPTQDVLSRPRTHSVARMLGVETVEPGRIVERSNGEATVQVGKSRLVAPDVGKSDDVLVCIRADEVELGRGTNGAATNRFEASVGAIGYDGPLIRIELDCGFPVVVVLPRSTAQQLSLELGASVLTRIPTSAVHLIDQT